ncbi:polysaccharide deacetylase family protein [Actinomadura rayongensis]|uniref:Polysaccharide deacetylase family protein n=1 Tax=Actinomadura rayongensis TaxID=1429076 RepID=A0A6I4W793_9ACTN|nr:polysaccharide deacetylase family protein [Actinomadura rayongensis]
MPLLHKLAAVLVVVAVVLGLTLPGDRDARRAATAVRAAAGEKAAAGRPPVPSVAPGSPRASGTPTPTPSVTAPIPPATAEAARVRADELGMVPVLMYHRIMKKPELSLDRSVQEFRDEVNRLADEGYAPITAAEFVAGRIDVPAGRHPVVLTFDDSTPGHFGLDAAGNPAPDTAVAILQEAARTHPGFRATATFYLNKDIFGLGDRAADGLKWLISHGYEIGNHTVTHADLSRLSKQGVRAEIGGMEDQIVALTGAHTTTFAYPFGAVPRKSEWARADGARYGFKGVFLAGWKPSASPFTTGFDRWAIDRVRSEGKIKENDCRQFCSTAWLDYLDKHPMERYTSDGDPATVTFPAAEEKRLAPSFRPYGRRY